MFWPWSICTSSNTEMGAYCIRARPAAYPIKIYNSPSDLPIARVQSGNFRSKIFFGKIGKKWEQFPTFPILFYFFR